MSDQIENRIIEAKSRGIYEAPGMALLHIAYERLVNAIHNEDTHRELPRRGPPARPAAVRGPLVRPAGADAARVAAALGRLGGHRRGHAAAAPRRRLHDPRHRPARTSPTTRTSCRWSGSSDAAFGPLDRIGQLTMRNLDIADTRAKLELYAALGQLDTQSTPSSASSPAAEADRRPARRRTTPQDLDTAIEQASDSAAMDAGTD